MDISTDIFHKFFSWFSHVRKEESQYVVIVSKGASLSSLAKDMTGDENRWQELVTANPERKFDADYTLQVGETLNIPKSWGAVSNG
jgi:hypothetical protein